MTCFTPAAPALLRESAVPESLVSDVRGRLDTASPPEDATLVALAAVLFRCNLSAAARASTEAIWSGLTELCEVMLAAAKCPRRLRQPAFVTSAGAEQGITTPLSIVLQPATGGHDFEVKKLS